MEVDEDAGIIRQSDLETTTQITTTGDEDEETERTESDLRVYSDALNVTELSEADLYDIESTECVRKADIDEKTKGTRLQGLKDRLVASDADNEEVQQLQDEIAELEARIEELTSFDSGASYHTSSATE